MQCGGPSRALRPYILRLCLVGLWLLQKLLWVVGCGKTAVRKQLWEKQKTVWLNGCGFWKNISHLHTDPTRHRHKNIFFHLPSIFLAHISPCNQGRGGQSGRGAVTQARRLGGHRTGERRPDFVEQGRGCWSPQPGGRISPGKGAAAGARGY
jgi:hypothetical protein